MADRFSHRRHDLIDVIGQFRAPLVALIVINTIGVLGFMIIDHYPFVDAVYQTVFTLTTVGYQETHPISQTGKLFVVLLILVGVLVWTYALGVVITMVVNADLLEKVRESMMESRVKKFNQHFIVAGYTEISRQVVGNLARQKIPYVIIDDNHDHLTEAGEDNISNILALNPFLNDSYMRANIAKARGIITTFPDDADNITAVITGKILAEENKQRLLIISVASHQESRDKLRKIGADVVILPHELVGQRISAMALHPTDQEQNSILDRMAFGEFLNLDIREVTLLNDNILDGVTIRDSNIRKATGAHILGIQRKGQRRIILMPNPDMHLHAGDRILVMGTLTQLQELPAFLNPARNPT